jgi:hypothetical protein
VEVTEEALARFFEVVLPHMNDVQRRMMAGAASEMLGRGGKTAVATASSMSRNTVIKAESEVTAGIEPAARLRAPGGGDRPLTDRQPACSPRSTSSYIPRPGATRCRGCAGHRGRRRTWPTTSSAKASRYRRVRW